MVERKNLHLLNVVHALLFNMHVPKKFCFNFFFFFFFFFIISKKVLLRKSKALELLNG